MEGDPSLRRGALIARLAAVDAFHPTAVPGATAAECMALVGRDVDVVSIDGHRTAWSLRLEVRRAALAALSGREAALAAALSIPARVQTDTQLLFERWLREGSESLVGEAAPRVVAWLELAQWAVGDVARARSRAAEAARLARLRLLGGDQFVGRKRERALLQAVVTGADPHRFVVVDAGGGMGKSSLLARLVLDVEGWRGDGPLAVAQVDFDDPEVDPRSDAGLLRAVAAELAPRLGGGLDALAEELSRLEREELRETSSTAALQADARLELDSRVHLAADHLGARIAKALADGRAARVAVLVDTFERAVRVSPELAGRSLALLWHVLEQLPAALVVCGRGLEVAARSLGGARPPLVVTLGELDRDSSVTILRGQGLEEGVAARLAAELVDRPLTLRLAGRAVSGAESVGPAERHAIQRALVDGYLHLRVLAHAGDPRLRAILGPGTALRQLAPELILALLGGLPTPPVADLADAGRLFDALSLAHDLVGSAPASSAITGTPRALALRPEVRRELLPLVEHDLPDAVRGVHERAAAWYDGRPELEARAEAVYHLLALERLADAKERWATELGPLLASSLEELPVPSREWLRIHLALDAEAEPVTSRAPRTQRDADEAPQSRATERLSTLENPGGSPGWDRGAARELEALLAARRLDAAGWLLAYWTERAADSPLHALAARFHRLVGQSDDAEREALMALGAGPSPPLRSEMRRILTWAAAQRGEVEEVERRVLEALVVTSSLDPDERLRGLVDLAEVLLPRQESVLRRRLWSIEDEVLAAFDQASDAALRADRALAVSSAAHLHDAARLARCLSLGAADGLRDPYLAGLAMALEAVESAPADLAEEAELLARADQALTVPTLRDGERPPRWIERLRALARMPERFVKWLARLLAQSAEQEAVLDAVREMLARDARSPADADATSRTEALASLARLVDAELDPAARLELAVALGGPTVLGPFEPSGPGLVSAADRCGQAGILLDWLGDRSPSQVERLAGLAERLLRPPPFRHFSQERLLDLWRALSRSPLIASGLAVLGPGLEEALVGPLPPGPLRPEHTTWLLRALARMNETPRLLGGAPLEQFLSFVSELSLGADSGRAVQSALDELWARRGLGAPDRDLGPAPLVGQLRALPAAFLVAGARAQESVQQLWVPRIEGGRRVIDPQGKPSGLRGTAWRVTRDLVVTSLFVVRARYPGDPTPDEGDLAAQIASAAIDGVEASGQVLVAWSEPLGYAVLEVTVGHEPLPLAAEVFRGGAVCVLMHGARGAKRLVLSEARATGREDGRLEYLADATHGWLGAPLFDEGWHVVGVDWGARVREGAYLRFAWPIADVLADLRQRFPAVAARIPRGG